MIVTILSMNTFEGVVIYPSAEKNILFNLTWVFQIFYKEHPKQAAVLEMHQMHIRSSQFGPSQTRYNVCICLFRHF